MPRWPAETSEQRFWRRVTKTKSCWLWDTPDPTNGGYGLIKIASVVYSAHRYSWSIHFGPIPKRMQVCHACDNPACVRPDHLFIGTQADNVADAVNKRRWNGPARSQPGELNPHAKLTWEIIDHIRASEKGSVFLARELGVHYVTTCAIRSGKKWPLEKHP